MRLDVVSGQVQLWQHYHVGSNAFCRQLYIILVNIIYAKDIHTIHTNIYLFIINILWPSRYVFLFSFGNVLVDIVYYVVYLISAFVLLVKYVWLLLFKKLKCQLCWLSIFLLCKISFLHCVSKVVSCFVFFWNYSD